MDRSIQFAQSMTNFDSAYNVKPTVYVPISSRSTTPLFHRSLSPTSRPGLSTRTPPKFNFDLYEDRNSDYMSGDYSGTSSYRRSRSPSPTSSSVIIHHHPLQSHRSPPSSSSPSNALSKLRQINDEMCHTLAQCDIPSPSRPPPPPQYHVHHHPLTQHPYQEYHSRSPSKSDSSTNASSEPSSPRKRHNARVTYKIRGPRRRHPKPPLAQVEQVLASTSDVYSTDDPMTIDYYPTRDQGFVKQIRNRPDNQSPWLLDGRALRRSSHSDSTTPRRSRTPDGPYYGDKPIKPPSRLASGKDRSRPRPVRQSPFVTSRYRPGSAPSYAPDPFRESTVSFSNSGPVWRPSGSIKKPKFMGSHDPPSVPKPPRSEPRWNPAGTVHKQKPIRALDPRSDVSPSKEPEPVWQPSSGTLSQKPPRYFEPTPKPEFVSPTGKRILDGTQSEPVPRRKSTTATRPKLRSGDPKLKARIEKAESKVKSAWQPTVTGVTEPVVREPRLPIPRPAQKTMTTTLPPKSTVKSAPTKKIVPTPQQPPLTTRTGRSSLNDVPTKPLFQSTPVNQSVVEEDDGNGRDFFGNESQLSEEPKQPDANARLPRPPPRVEKTPSPPVLPPPPQPQKTPNELPKTTVPEPNKGTTTTVKDGVLIQENDVANNRGPIRKPAERSPTPTSEINDQDNNDNHGASDVHNAQPSPPPIRPPTKVPTPDRKVVPPKPTNNADVSVVDDDEDAFLPAPEGEGDEDDEEVARSFRINKWLDDASKAIIGAAKTNKGDNTTPPPRPAPPATPPRRKEQPPASPAESPDHNLYKPPFGPKKKEQPPPVTPPSGGAPGAGAPSGDAADDVSDFFN